MVYQYDKATKKHCEQFTQEIEIQITTTETNSDNILDTQIQLNSYQNKLTTIIQNTNKKYIQ